jgi:hypothetical protein
MPDEFRFLFKDLRGRVPRIMIAVASREDDDTEFHRDTSILTETSLRSHYREKTFSGRSRTVLDAKDFD